MVNYQTKFHSLIPILLVVMSFIVSCSNQPKREKEIFNALHEGFNMSNRSISKATQSIYAELEQKLAEPFTRFQASIWFPKVLTIRKHSDSIINYINALKEDLNEESNFDADKADSLYVRLNQYRKDVLAIDSQLAFVFDTVLITVTREFDLQPTEKKNFASTFFHNTPEETIGCMLAKFENNIRISENKMITFCNNKVSNNAFIIEDYDSYAALIGQSSSYLRPGEIMEITAGLGEFSQNSSMEIWIDGKKAKINSSGYATYEFPMLKKPGKYSLPVDIIFNTDSDKKQTISKTIEYTVAKE